MHRQIKIVAILLMVEGGLEVLVGIYLCVMGPVAATMFKSSPPPGLSGPGMPSPDGFLAIYITMGVVTLIASVLKIVGGIRNLSLKGRALGFVALGSCLLSLFSCYCSLFALGLGIYGLIVYVNERSAQAFKLVDGGMTPEQAIAQLDATPAYGASPPQYPPQYPPQV